MKQYYIHIFKDNSILLSNLPDDLRNEADECSYEFINSMCAIKHIKRLQYKESITNGYIYMCSYDTSMTKKIFFHYFDMLKSVYDAYEEKIKNEKERLIKDLRRLQHNINTYNATIHDEITNLIPLDDIRDEWKEVVPFVEDIVQRKSKLTAITLLKTIKFSTFVTAEMTVHDYINSDNIKLEKYSHSMHRIVKLSLQPYFLEFVEKGIDIKIGDCYEKVSIDYPTISVVLGHIWNNAIKYIYKDSSLDINFNTSKNNLITTIKMYSLKIEEDEIEDIYTEGYSGKWAKKIEEDGHGIGMFYIKHLIEMNDGSFSIKTGTNITNINGIPYVNNEFLISLPLD